MFFSRKPYLYIAAAVFAVWAVYCYNPFALYFQNDDFTNILLSSKHQLFQRNSFRPVCDLSVMLDYTLFGTNAAGYHLMNLLLHIICSVLVFFFSRRMFVLFFTGGDKTAFAILASLLFFMYPMHSESVFWILGRSGTLGAIFALLFLLAFLKEKYTTASIAAFITWYVLALFTYESCWVLLPVAALLTLGLPAQGRVGFKRRRYYFIILLAIFILYLLMRRIEDNELLNNYEAENFFSVNITVLAQHYAQLVIRSFIAYFEAPPAIIAGFAVVFAVLGWLLFKCDRNRRFFAGLMMACFMLSLLPYLSLGIDTHGTGGERFLYLPSVFLCAGMAVLIAAIPYKTAFAITCLTCFVYSLQLYVNAGNYRFAGSVVKQTMLQLQADSSRNIVIEGLPRAQYGAMILENGLQQATLLLGMGKDTSAIRVQSRRSELRPLVQPYKTIHTRVSEDEGVSRYVFTDTALFIYR